MEHDDNNSLLSCKPETLLGKVYKWIAIVIGLISIVFIFIGFIKDGFGFDLGIVFRVIFGLIILLFIVAVYDKLLTIPISIFDDLYESFIKDLKVNLGGLALLLFLLSLFGLINGRIYLPNSLLSFFLSFYAIDRDEKFGGILCLSLNLGFLVFIIIKNTFF